MESTNKIINQCSLGPGIRPGNLPSSPAAMASRAYLRHARGSLNGLWVCVVFVVCICVWSRWSSLRSGTTHTPQDLWIGSTEGSPLKVPLWHFTGFQPAQSTSPAVYTVQGHRHYSAGTIPGHLLCINNTPPPNRSRACSSFANRVLSLTFISFARHAGENCQYDKQIDCWYK